MYIYPNILSARWDTLIYTPKALLTFTSEPLIRRVWPTQLKVGTIWVITALLGKQNYTPCRAQVKQSWPNFVYKYVSDSVRGPHFT